MYFNPGEYVVLLAESWKSGSGGSANLPVDYVYKIARHGPREWIVETDMSGNLNGYTGNFVDEFVFRSAFTSEIVAYDIKKGPVPATFSEDNSIPRKGKMPTFAAGYMVRRISSSPDPRCQTNGIYEVERTDFNSAKQPTIHLKGISGVAFLAKEFNHYGFKAGECIVLTKTVSTSRYTTGYVYKLRRDFNEGSTWATELDDANSTTNGFFNFSNKDFRPAKLHEIDLYEAIGKPVKAPVTGTDYMGAIVKLQTEAQLLLDDGLGIPAARDGIKIIPLHEITW